MRKIQIFLFPVFYTVMGAALIMAGCKKNEEEAGGTTPQPPTAITAAASLVGQEWAVLNGSSNPQNITTAVYFEYDTVTPYTKSVNASPESLTGSSSSTVTAVLTGLKQGKTYHFRLKAVNSAGTTYGSDLTFTTTPARTTFLNFNAALTYGTVSDIEGNSYRTVGIGTQTWMAENLRTRKYNDGTAIPFILGVSAWASATTPGYCWYNGDSTQYGALYNWYSVNTGKLCPAGWHVPTDAEWTTLTGSVGGQNVAGGMLKETGTSHWLSPNTGATNESGFTAIPAGYRDYYGYFNNIKRTGFWWSATESSSTEAWFRDMQNTYANTDRSSSSKKSGFSVRCLKD